jgi:hypothetical protein
MGVSQAVKSDSREPRGGNLTAEGFSEMRGVDGLALRPMREYQIHLAEPDAETKTGVLLKDREAPQKCPRHCGASSIAA